MSLFFQAAPGGYGGTIYEFTTAGYILLVAIMLVLLLGGCAIFGGKQKLTAKQLAFSAMAIALAMVTSMIKVFELPMGGSVTLLSMLFVVLVGYWFGLGTGLTTALAYGLLQLVVDPYVISLPQMFVDYVFAFGALGLAGVFHGKKQGLLKGYILAVCGRYFFATLSGVIFFGTSAPDSFPNPLAYSLAYNGSYLGAEALITLIIICLPPVAHGLDSVKRLAMAEI